VQEQNVSDDLSLILDRARRRCFEHECTLAKLQQHLRPISKAEVTRLAHANPEVWGEYEGMGYDA
jgi:hypothetical protein